MRTFISNFFLMVVYLFLPIISIVIISNYFHVFPDGKGDYDKNEFEKAFSNGNYEIIALGNSKMQDAISKEVLENSLNKKSVMLTSRGADISISKLTLESYLNNCKVKPEIVLLEVSWFTFNNQRTNFSNLAGDLFIRDLRLFKHVFRYDPKIRSLLINSVFNNIFAKESSANDKISLSNNEKYTSSTKDYNFDLISFEKIFPDHTAGVNKLLLQDYFSIHEMCKSRSIQLILFTAPEDEDYSIVQSDRELIKSYFKNYNNYLFLDYTIGGSLWQKKYELWLRDSHHIQEKDLFTKKLTSDILRNIKL